MDFSVLESALAQYIAKVELGLLLATAVVASAVEGVLLLL